MRVLCLTTAVLAYLLLTFAAPGGMVLSVGVHGVVLEEAHLPAIPHDHGWHDEHRHSAKSAQASDPDHDHWHVDIPLPDSEDAPDLTARSFHAPAVPAPAQVFVPVLLPQSEGFRRGGSHHAHRLIEAPPGAHPSLAFLRSVVILG